MTSNRPCSLSSSYRPTPRTPVHVRAEYYDFPPYLSVLRPVQTVNVLDQPL
jgi:hypothetical protein